MQKTSFKRKITATVIALVAGILYCSWPLEYVLNPTVATHRGLASELGAPGQPYWWLFNLLDILSSLLIISVAFMLWRIVRIKKRWFKVAIASYVLFAVLTITDALMPLHCIPSTGQCGPLIDDPLIVAHGAASIGAGVFLFVSTVAVWRICQTAKLKNLKPVIYLILLGWGVFGLSSLIFLFVKGPGYLAQHYFITFCSLWIAIVPAIVLRTRPNAMAALRYSSLKKA
ncbi:MAG TPA: DUF998 domain-containing protein [Patescibacteria group bacterium]|nr:DUF998 domain-containing protein [Patescibacteria group bacterium]